MNKHTLLGIMILRVGMASAMTPSSFFKILQHTQKEYEAALILSAFALEEKNKKSAQRQPIFQLLTPGWADGQIANSSAK